MVHTQHRPDCTLPSPRFCGLPDTRIDWAPCRTDWNHSLARTLVHMWHFGGSADSQQCIHRLPALSRCCAAHKQYGKPGYSPSHIIFFFGIPHRIGSGTVLRRYCACHNVQNNWADSYLRVPCSPCSRSTLYGMSGRLAGARRRNVDNNFFFHIR